MVKIYTGRYIKQHPDKKQYFEIEDNCLMHCNVIAEKVDKVCLLINHTIWTNSDHVINRFLVRHKNEGIELEIVFLHNGESKLIIPEKGGRIRYAPKGFFDQFTIDRKDNACNCETCIKTNPDDLPLITWEENGEIMICRHCSKRFTEGMSMDAEAKQREKAIK